MGGLIPSSSRTSRAAASVGRGAIVERKLWIEVDPSGASFVWRQVDQAHHAVDDPAGAAAQIAEYLRRHEPRSDER